MKRGKVTASEASVRVKVDRAETYPGGREETTADGAKKMDYRRYNSSARVGSTSGNNVIRWFKHITDAAESYKSKDSAKSKKLVQQSTAVEAQTTGGGGGEGREVGGRGGVGGGGGGTSTAFYETTKSVENGSRRHENEDGEDRRGGGGAAAAAAAGTGRQAQQQQSAHAVRRVEVLQFEEEPLLVQPDEVKVSLTRVIDRHDDAIAPMSSLDVIKEKNRLIEAMLIEKKNLVANVLQIPVNSYDHISEVVDEVRNTSDVRELLLSSLTQADILTQLINEQLDANLVLREDRSTSLSRGQDVNETRGTMVPDAVPHRTRTRVAHSRTVAVDQNPAEGNQLLEEGGRELRSCPNSHPTPHLADEELQIVVPCSQLMAISSRLCSNLTQLMELVESRDRERVAMETELSQCNDSLSRLTSQGHGVIVTSEGEDNESPAEHRGEFVTEHLEVIEAERIIEPERVVTLAPHLLPASATVTKTQVVEDMSPSTSDDS